MRKNEIIEIGRERGGRIRQRERRNRAERIGYEVTAILTWQTDLHSGVIVVSVICYCHSLSRREMMIMRETMIMKRLKYINQHLDRIAFSAHFLLIFQLVVLVISVIPYLDAAQRYGEEQRKRLCGVWGVWGVCGAENEDNLTIHYLIE